MSTEKEAWFVYTDKYDECGLVAIAHNLHEAKVMVAKEAHCDIDDLYGDVSYEILGVEIDDLEYGIIDPWIGLSRGMYRWIDETCPEWKYKKSCHLFTDGDIELLHSFAVSIGLKRRWFHDRHSFPHYDLTASKRALAVSKGAKEIRLKDFLSG